MIRYLDWAHGLASRIFKRMNASHVMSLDDVKSFAVFGLMDAAKKFKKSFGVKFKTYAHRRISGTIIDHCRSESWVPRAELQKKKPDDIVRMQQFPAAPDSDDNNENFGKTAEDTIQDKRIPAVDYELINQENWDNLIKGLAARDIKMIEMYYLKGITMREIGEELEISESRVCQLMGQALNHVQKNAEFQEARK